jgi:hypothetical protein
LGDRDRLVGPPPLCSDSCLKLNRESTTLDKSIVVRYKIERSATGKRERPPLVPTPGVGRIQAVQRCCRGRIVRVGVRPVLGEAVDGLYPVHEERWNGVVRNRLNALTRKTRVFAKTVKTWDARVILCLFEHNGLRPHWALREAQEGLPEGRRDRLRTPAMAIGWIDHLL